MTYPGFDPAPGNHSALASLSRACTGLAVELADDARRARALRDLGVWTGRAAEAFGDCGGTLPQVLDRASQAFDEAALAVATFGSTVERQQQQARVLARRIEDPTLDPQARADLVRQAHHLCHPVTEEAARQPRSRARDPTAPRPPSWFAQALGEFSHEAQRVNDRVGAFVRQNAGAIAALSAVCSQVSSPLAVTAMLLGPIPVLGEAVVTGGVALLGHAALAAYAGAGWGHDRVRRRGPCNGRRADGCRGGGRSGRHPRRLGPG